MSQFYNIALSSPTILDEREHKGIHTLDNLNKPQGINKINPFNLPVHVILVKILRIILSAILRGSALNTACARAMCGLYAL